MVRSLLSAGFSSQPSSAVKPPETVTLVPKALPSSLLHCWIGGTSSGAAVRDKSSSKSPPVRIRCRSNFSFLRSPFVPKSPVRESSWVRSYSRDAEDRFYPGAGDMVPSPQVPMRESRGDGGDVPKIGWREETFDIALASQSPLGWGLSLCGVAAAVWRVIPRLIGETRD
ncbi:hypothetical protein ACLB2K_073588 [Fragaria x ananassa]